jgi:hypothetical protein
MPLLNWIVLIAAAVFVAYRIVNGPVKPKPGQWNPSRQGKTLLIIGMVLFIVLFFWVALKRGH